MARKDKRSLQLKFRLGITQRMTKSDAMRKLKQAVRTGFVPDGIVIHWVQWAHAKEGHFDEGTQLSGDQLEELQLWYGVLVSGDVTANKVS